MIFFIIVYLFYFLIIFYVWCSFFTKILSKNRLDLMESICISKASLLSFEESHYRLNIDELVSIFNLVFFVIFLSVFTNWIILTQFLPLINFIIIDFIAITNFIFLIFSLLKELTRLFFFWIPMGHSKL